MVPQRVRRAGHAAVAALAVLLAGAATARAQESGSVRGRVVDAATQRPLDGAQITIEGTRFGGMANQNGDFLILNVPTGTYTVRAQMLGYNRQDVEVTIAAGQAAVTSFELRQAAIDLDAIVVTGTAGGTVRRALGNSVTRLETGDLTEQAPIANVQELLTARAPGVTLMSSSGQAGASSKIRIRGASSLSAGNEPVFYVDGVRVAAGTNGGYGVNNGTVQGTNPLDYLNPDDIESIEVIKGPSAATLYGADAAAGVIQIITKKGRASQGVQFTAEVEMGTSEWALDMPTNYTLCMTDEEGDALGARFFGDRISTAPGLSPEDAAEVAEDWPGCSAFNVSQPLQQRVLTQQPARDDPRALRVGDIRGMSVSARGGNEAFNFYLSADNYDEDGVFFNNFSKRTSGRGNFGFVPSDKLNFNVSVGYARTHVQMPLQNNASNSILRNAFRGRPGNQGPWGVGWRGFIPEISNQYDNQNWQERTTVGLTMNYTPIPGFTNRLTLGMDRNDRTNQSFMRQDTTGRAPWGAVSATGTIDRYLPSIHVWTLDYASTLANDLTPDLNSQFSVGMQVNARQFESHEVNGEGLVANRLNLVGSAAVTFSDQDREEQTSAGFFIQEQVGWRDRLYLTGAVRVDDNSAFGQDFSFVAYPKFMASYVVSEEDFFELPAVDELKLRLAYGQAGNAPPPFSADRTFSPDKTEVDGSIVNHIQFSDYGNPDLKAETGSEIELGFDALVLGGRIGAEFTYYNKKTLDALVEVPDPRSSGYIDEHMINVGEIRNSGVELLLTGSPVNTPNVRWDATLSLATNGNELVDFGTESLDDITFGAFADVQRHIEGYPLAGFWARDVERDGSGRPILYDGAGNVTTDPLVGNVRVNEAFEYVGPMLPTREIGFSSTVTLFEDLQLFANLDYKGGNYQWCAICSIRNRIDLNTWEINNPDQDPVERLVWRSLQTKTHIHPADFMKLREVALTYTLPASISQRFRASRTSLTLSGRNLWMWTKYAEATSDPEVTFYSTSSFTQLDYASTPMTRRLMASLRFVF